MTDKLAVRGRLFGPLAGRLEALLKGIVKRLVRLLLDAMRLRYLPVLVERIGHLAFEPDAFLKEGLLGLRPPYRGILCIPDGSVANRTLARYWSPYFVALSSPRLCRIVSFLCMGAGRTYNVPAYGISIDLTAGYARIQQHWRDRGPLLKLTEEDRQRGWERLAALGVPADAWFVCFHSREPGYATHDDGLHTYRNSDVRSYLPAVQSIVDRGGWCIRMGDSSMRPLPPMERVIDYPHSDAKSDWMDVFLCASCRFFLGNSSGLSSVSGVFGVPAALANLAPISTLPFGPRDIGIPKRVWWIDKARYLTLEEAFASPSSTYRFTHLFDEAGLRADENLPEDIRDLALEMLDVLDGRLIYGDDDERMQAAYRALLRPGHYSYGVPSRVGRGFLQRYAQRNDHGPLGS